MVGKMLERNGCSDYMVEIGGEIALSGANRNGEPWHIMIDAPLECDTAVVHDGLRWWSDRMRNCHIGQL